MFALLKCSFVLDFFMSVGVVKEIIYTAQSETNNNKTLHKVRLSPLDTNLKQGAHKRGDPTPHFQGRKFGAISLSSCSQECLDSYLTASARKTLVLHP